MTAAASRFLDPRALWSRALALLKAEGAEALGAAAGFAGPLAVGVASGHVGAGLAAATGALMAGGGPVGSGLAGSGLAGGGRPAARPRSGGLIAMMLAAPLLATAYAQAVAGHGWATGVAVTGAAFLAALTGSFSRPMAVATARFNVFLIISLGVVAGSGVHAGGAMLMVGAGAVWASMTARVATRLAPRRTDDAEAAPEPAYPFRRRFGRWLKTLRTVEGWSFALKLGAGVAVAEAGAALWPDHHLHWIALTVVLLTARRAEPGGGRIRDRAAGTAVGVLVAGLLLLWRPPPWGLVAAVALIAGMRPFLRARSYMAYSVAMTPLIVLLQDFSHPPQLPMLGDRLAATLAGAALVMAGARLLPPPALVPAKRISA